MASILMSDFYTSELPSIIEKLDENYYDVIESHCGRIESGTSGFAAIAEHASNTLYLSLCIKLIEKIRHHIQMRKLVTMPYIYQLHEKVMTEHDCSTCKDGCQVSHSIKLSGIKDGHAHIREMLQRLQMLSMPLYEEKASPDNSRDLREEIMTLDAKLTEMFYLEEAVLLPKMIEAQRKIHVRN